MIDKSILIANVSDFDSRPSVAPLQLSLETVLAASPLLGHPLEDRSCIREAQETFLVREWQERSTIPLRGPSQQGLFAVAPLDILVTEEEGQKQFHIIEFNGTGIGGLTNMTADAIHAVLACLTQTACQCWQPEAVVLVASSGKESEQAPRRNRLLYEKLLYAEALKRGLEQGGSRVSVVSMPQVVQDRRAFLRGRPTVVLGYIKDFLEHLRLEPDGQLSLFGRLVTALVNDRFCLNVIDHFGHQVDLRRLVTLNRGFLVGADKGVAYGVLNEYFKEQPHPLFPSPVRFAQAICRAGLIETVLDWVEQGRRVVIKPRGTGCGHGIEFFLSPQERTDQIIEKIDRSIRITEQYYWATGGAFPYTVCEFLDACVIARPDHPFYGHKYELRVVVYRDGLDLMAFPSVVKVSRHTFERDHPDRASLINNITAASEPPLSADPSAMYMLPLANEETLALLGLSPEQLGTVCSMATGFVRHVLDQVQDQPERFGLPGPGGRVQEPPRDEPRPQVRLQIA